MWRSGLLARALAAQCLAAVLVLLVFVALREFAGVWLPWPPRLLLCMLLAGGLAWRFALPRWWWLICALFPAAVALAWQLQLPASVYAVALLLSFAVFGSIHRSRVPLWLSGGGARRGLIELLPDHPGFAFVDLGGGFAGVLASVAAARPRARLCGREWAWLPYAIGWLRLRLLGVPADWRCASFWSLDLQPFDLVYAYLSPAAMPALWDKARAEMRPGSRLVSYRFAIPGVAATSEIRVGAGEHDLLRIWCM